MLKEQNSTNDGEGFTLNGKRIEWTRYWIAFIYSDKYGLIADDDIHTTHYSLGLRLTLEKMSHYFPDNFLEGIKYDILGCTPGWWDAEECWKKFYKHYTQWGLKPHFDDISKFMQFMTPFVRKFKQTFDDAHNIRGRAYLIEDNTTVLTFWWENCEISSDDVLKIVSFLKDEYPVLRDTDFYIALANEVVPLKEFTGDFNASDEDREEVAKRQEIHLANCREKHKALNPYLKDRNRHQGEKLQMSNGDEMTQAEYNSYLHQEGIRRMVKGVILEYLNLKTKLVIR